MSAPPSAQTVDALVSGLVPMLQCYEWRSPTVRGTHQLNPERSVELVNQTPLVAEAGLSEAEMLSTRIGILTAKATFTLNGNAEPVLDTQAPIDLLRMETPLDDLGVMPPDSMPRRTDMVEVMLLAAAYAPGGKAVDALRVSLEVGVARAEMYVFGERSWDGTGSRALPSAPVPFTRMPLVWENAFGGKVPIYLDAKNSIDAAEQWNPRGKGFDASPYVRAFGEQLGAAPGFPQLPPRYVRPLPNLENPAELIRAWSDTPAPCCWATTPMDVPYRMKAIIERKSAGQRPTTPDDLSAPESLEDYLAPERAPEWDAFFARAHPTWRLSPLPQEARVMMENVHPRHRTMSFPLPQMRVVADYVIHGRNGTIELAPQMIVLMPEHDRMTITYRATFTAQSIPETERSFRLRTEQGWYTPKTPPRKG